MAHRTFSKHLHSRTHSPRSAVACAPRRRGVSGWGGTITTTRAAAAAAAPLGRWSSSGSISPSYETFFAQSREYSRSSTSHHPKQQGAAGDGKALRRSSTQPADALDTFHQLVTRVQQQQERCTLATEGRRRSAFLFLGDLAFDFAKKYNALPPILSKGGAAQCRRVQVLNSLVDDTSLTTRVEASVQAAIAQYTQVAQSKDPDLKLPTDRLRIAATPFYEDLVRCLLESSTRSTLSLLMHLRADVQTYIRFLQQQLQQQPSDDDNHQLLLRLLPQLKRFNNHLREVLATWFSPSILQVQRIQYDTTPAAIIEHIVRNEAVHPVKDLNDLRTRLGPGRRVFGLQHPLLLSSSSEKKKNNRHHRLLPLVLVHVSLQEADIPARMTQIHQAPVQEEIAPKVAAFYSISNLEAGLVGLGLGEHLLKEAVQLLRQEFGDSLETMCTLSPLPGFQKWLFQGQHGPSSKVGQLLQCPPEQALTQLREQLLQHQQQDYGDLPDNENAPVAQALLHMAARYLVQEKHRGKPLDPVARFHLGNGAAIFRINWKAQQRSSSKKCLDGGIMVNYEYNVNVDDKDNNNNNNYQLESQVPVHSQVASLLREEKE